MIGQERGIPARVLLRFAALVARCDASSGDLGARKSLTVLAAVHCRDFPALSERALAVLAQDDRFAVRREASTGLRALLERLDGLARIRVMVDWAMSDQRRLRAAVARALCTHLPILGVVPALDQLAHDAHAEVRRAACAACARRLQHGGDAFAEIVRDGSRDAHRSVRVVAIGALEKTAAEKPNPEPTIEALYECTRSNHPGSARRARHALRHLGCYSVERERRRADEPVGCAGDDRARCRVTCDHGPARIGPPREHRPGARDPRAGAMDAQSDGS
jgi:hypothetical protein